MTKNQLVKLLQLAVIGAVIAGIGFILLYLPRYEANGCINLTQTEWTDFTQQLIKNHVDIKRVNVINIGDSKTVSFYNIKVSSRFPYGTIEKVELRWDKFPDKVTEWLGVACIVLGLVPFILLIFGTIASIDYIGTGY